VHDDEPVGVSSAPMAERMSAERAEDVVTTKHIGCRIDGGVDLVMWGAPPEGS
jgi:hypothetical protein